MRIETRKKEVYIAEIAENSKHEFLDAEECLNFEALYSKWWLSSSKHRYVLDEEGNERHCFFVENSTEAEELQYVLRECTDFHGTCSINHGWVYLTSNNCNGNICSIKQLRTALEYRRGEITNAIERLNKFSI